MNQRYVVVAAALGLLCWAAPRAHAGALQASYTAPARAKSAVVARGGRLFVPERGAIVAYRQRDGERLWRRAISGLRHGAHTVAASDKHVYAVSRAGLLVIDAASGKVLSTRKARGALSVIFASGSLYFSDKSGVFRLDAQARTTLGMARLSGELRAVHDKRALIYRVEKRPKKGESPKRLMVLDLSEWRATYTFKLLPTGDHAVANFDDRNLAFFDHSARYRGKNARKLFYTEVDHRTQRKLRDLSLSKLYKRDDRDRFSSLSTGDGRVIVANYGGRGASLVFALDTKAKRMMWRDKSMSLQSRIVRLGETICAVVKEGGAYKVVRLDANTGHVIDRAPIAAAPSAPIAVSNNLLLVPTSKGVVVLSAKAVLAFAMILGRLEFFTLMVMLTPAFWRGMKQRHERGEVLDVFPYPASKRLGG